MKTLVKLAIFRQRISSAYLTSFPQAHSKKVQLFWTEISRGNQDRARSPSHLKVNRPQHVRVKLFYGGKILEYGKVDKIREFAGFKF